MSIKESEYIDPALKALQEGKYKAAINLLRLASMDTPAATSDDPETVALDRAANVIARARVWWLMMIAQRFDGQFVEAEETLRLIGFYTNDPTIAELVSAYLFEILVRRAEENSDELTLQLLLAARPT